MARVKDCDQGSAAKVTPSAKISVSNFHKITVTGVSEIRLNLEGFSIAYSEGHLFCGYIENLRSSLKIYIIVTSNIVTRNYYATLINTFSVK